VRAVPPCLCLRFAVVPCPLCSLFRRSLCFFFHDTPPTEIYTLSLHDALPISPALGPTSTTRRSCRTALCCSWRGTSRPPRRPGRDRKSTRLNSSHVSISYAVFCLKKKNRHRAIRRDRTLRKRRRTAGVTTSVV